MMNTPYKRIHRTEDPPESMTMDRLGELDELIVAQTTQLCFRKGCCTPSINWVLLDSSNYDLTSGGSGNPFELPSVGGWIHEESSFAQRCCCHAPGCRETRFVHHAGLPPESLGNEDYHCCVIQTSPTSHFLTPHDVSAEIVAIHEKQNTCPTNCCCFPENLPYLRTLDAQGEYLGETKYVCDGCIFVPKFLVLDKYQEPKFLLRPDTCLGGLCMQCRCGGRQGKCCRLPFLIRDPITKEPMRTRKTADVEEEAAQVTQLWSGLANEVCFRRHAYHIAFPKVTTREGNDQLLCTVEDKLVLIGASILVDVALFEKEDDK
eukprot:CAMPEP_0194201658 /NCGR_PEP_ID=MMETSP0156-20130528/1873_1 /TAXON_ID=33649 /ORGANISM="Thalassionema nitzschioides, Strain L26-B" /LENGTH=318 /DNA_ID=CAMNT_0038926913 /DNA_START=43 /DNA_END=999 /DNA_ORIENTATION=-